MNIICKTLSPSGAYPPINSISNNVVPDGWLRIEDSVDTSIMQTKAGFVKLTVDEEVVTAMTANDKAYQTYLDGIPGPTVEEIKDVQTRRIAESKTALAGYLESHPLTWTDGKQYSVTEDKQALLTGNLAAYQLAVTLGQENPELTWNATGEECTVWTFENLAMLAIAIKAYVKPLVAYQQKTEIAIRACTTAEDVGNIVIDYVQTAAGGDAE